MKTLRIIPFAACLFLVTCASLQVPIGQDARYGKFVVGYEAPTEAQGFTFPILTGFKK